MTTTDEVRLTVEQARAGVEDTDDAEAVAARVTESLAAAPAGRPVCRDRAVIRQDYWDAGQHGLRECARTVGGGAARQRPVAVGSSVSVRLREGV